MKILIPLQIREAVPFYHSAGSLMKQDPDPTIPIQRILVHPIPETPTVMEQTVIER